MKSSFGSTLTPFNHFFEYGFAWKSLNYVFLFFVMKKLVDDYSFYEFLEY